MITKCFKRTYLIPLFCLCLCLCLSYSFSTIAQDLPPGFKVWYSTGLSIDGGKKWDFYISQLHALNTSPTEVQFVQQNINARRRLNKSNGIKIGFKPNLFKNNESSSFSIYNRLYLESDHRHKLFGLPMKHQITAEWHFPQLRKYRFRGIYSLKYYLKNDFLPLDAVPYLKGQIYYYYGGRELSYYDENRVTIVKQAPNDFHRYRLVGGVRMKLSKNIRWSLYYILQREFNTNLTTHRDLNIPSKGGKNIRIPFNNYSVVGTSLVFRLRKK